MEEKKSTYKLLRECALELCSGGFYVFRFDLSGCGDSEGEFENCTVKKWLEDIKSAIKYLGKEYKAIKNYSLLGLRFGATLAAYIREEINTVDSLCLWAPIISGQHYVKLNLKRQIVLNLWKKKQKNADFPISDNQEGIDFGGYFLSNVLIEEIKNIDLINMDKREGAKILILALNENSNFTNQFHELKKTYDSSLNEVKIDIIEGDPFWDYIGLSKWPDLIRLTNQWFKNNVVVKESIT